MESVLTTGNYKTAIRLRIKALNERGRKVTLRQVAQAIPVQYTYLSRVFNADDKHLNEDQLFVIGNLLDFTDEEIQHLNLLRAVATTSSPARRAHLQKTLSQRLREQKLSAEVRGFSGEILQREADYLFEPLCVVVHVALGIAKYRKHPHLLASALGVGREALKEVLRKLRDVGFIELGPDGQVKSVTRAHSHYGLKHPLMRAHQNYLRQLSQSQLMKTPEKDRHSFMVTFTENEDTFVAAKEAFQTMIRGLEKQVEKGPNDQVYQLSFDLFKWL